MNFLGYLGKDLHLSYSAVNTARSALSNYVQKMEGFPAGVHPEISKFLKKGSSSCLHDTNQENPFKNSCYELFRLFSQRFKTQLFCS